jgi:hypothetical protein
VAVLDTGVAYETSGRFVAAPGLLSVPIADPLDLVEGDDHPNDDHQHGTHLASLIASRSLVPGVVPGVTLIPVKVLDATSSGTEYDLIEGLWHAIDHGADVIDLSLSFPLGYVPSPALREVLEAAWDAEVVVVAAAGNDGETDLTWPAASRLVVSVGAARSKITSTDATDYSNLSPALEVLAPGGQLDVDEDRDGFVDGVVAETFAPADPAAIGWWAFQGTSQSAALVSGLAVRLLAAGIPPHDVGPALQEGAGGYLAPDAAQWGTGAGVPDLGTAIEATAQRLDPAVALLPYLADLPPSGEPRAKVGVVDAGGEPLVGAWVQATLYGIEGVTWPSCVTGGDGTCTLDPQGAGGGDAWAFRVDVVAVDGVAQRPVGAEFGADGLVAAVDALEDRASEGDVLAVYWEAGVVPELGPVAEAWAVTDRGPSEAIGPLGVLFRPAAVAGTAIEGELALDVDGTGLLSSPLSTFTSRTLTLSGSGLLSSPYGSLRLVSLSGTGLLSSPLGTQVTRLYAASDGELALESTTGAHSSGGYPAASTLIGAGAVSVGLTAGGVASGPTAASVPWAP